MMIGIPIFFFGVVGLNPHRCRLSMNSALAIGIIGVTLVSGRAILLAVRMSRGVEINQYTFKLICATSLLCMVFIIAWAIARSYKVRAAQ